MRTILFSIFFLPFSLFAQWHDAIWKMGQKDNPNSVLEKGMIIDFNVSPPNFYKQPCSVDAHFSFSDEYGNLLFYTEGINLFDASDQVIENGNPMNLTPLVPNVYGIAKSLFAIPKPEHPNQYYLFYLSWVPPYFCCPQIVNYSIVDMSLNNGKGKVIEQHKIVDLPQEINGVYGISIVKHANGRDWWLVVPNRRANNPFFQFDVFLVSPKGITWHTQADTQVTIPTDQAALNFNWFRIAFSLDGSHFIHRFFEKTIVSYFDRCAGIMTPWKVIEVPDVFGYGSDMISKNNRFLYQGVSPRVYQYDLTAPDIEVSKTVVIENNLNGGMPDMQYGPDGRVYAASINPQPIGNNEWENWIQGITFPDKKGLACLAKSRFFRIPAPTGYPAQYPNYRLGPIDGSPCDTLGLDNHPLASFRWDFVDTANHLNVNFTDNSFYEPQTWFWDFGDGTTSQDTSPVHIFPADGLYHVCLTVCNPFSCDSVCQWVNIGQVSGVEKIGETQNQISISPNPTNCSRFQIRSSIFPIEKVILFDLLGRAFQPHFSKEMDIEVVFEKALPSGTYFVQTTLTDGTIVVQKLIVRSE